GVCYSYWCNHWMLRLSLLKKAGLIKSLVCRVHGFDLYSERHKVGFIPHQAAMLKSADHVFVISQHGKTYLTNKFALKNIKLSKLGVPDHGLGPIPNQLETIQIVSCSNLIAVKQVHLIIDALRQVKRNVVWRHFGGGFLSVELKKLAAKLPENITVIWMGQTSNKNILSFYKNHPVHLFLNVSQSEGLPVSIMEAMSFGIPVAAPSVGGIPEIVNDSNGYDLGIEKIEEILATYIQDMNERLHLKRQNARQMYLRNFSLTNFTHFINQI
ncbi:MAG: glycosyltransferase involved in cell wall biosynthesis, partial [Psychroserpens sp.]